MPGLTKSSGVAVRAEQHTKPIVITGRNETEGRYTIT